MEDLQPCTSNKKTPNNGYYLGFCGGATRNRTRDTRIFSPVLYLLSYGTDTFLTLNNIGQQPPAFAGKMLFILSAANLCKKSIAQKKMLKKYKSERIFKRTLNL